MFRLVAVLILLNILATESSSAAILIEEKGQSLNQNRFSMSSSSGLDLRRNRKMGIGIAGAGVWGSLGTQLELNLSSRLSLAGGVGLGEGYKSFALQLRKYLSGESFLPYIAGGFARWYTTGKGMTQTEHTNPSLLAERFLSSHEKNTGQFSELFLFPTVGIQYFQLRGDWMGSSLFAELNLLIDIDDLVVGPTGSLGYTYFF